MEQSLPLFLFSAVLISLSGVLSPGPLTAAVIEGGSRSRLTGLYVSLGHAAVEMPLIAFIALGAGSVLSHGPVRAAVGAAGGLYLLYMARGMLGQAPAGAGAEPGGASSVLSGVVLSAGNPYFVLWWATVGAGLVISASGFGAVGLVLFALLHWLCDLAWLAFLSIASHRGARAFGARLSRKVSVFCGVVMLFYGGLFIYNSARAFMQMK
jgi:threonine/homoserine/homoserine lactone efflux protein